MTFGSSGTGMGMDNSIPEILEWEGNGKNPFPKFGNGKGIKKIHSHNSGMGIRGFHSWEWTGTGIPAHPCTSFHEDVKISIVSFAAVASFQLVPKYISKVEVLSKYFTLKQLFPWKMGAKGQISLMQSLNGDRVHCHNLTMRID